MALAVIIQFQFKDNKGKTSKTDVKVPTGFSIAQYIEFAQGAGQVIANVTTCQITSVSINFALDLSGATLTNVAGVAADVAAKALLGFRSAVSGFFARMKIPTFDEENLIVLGTDQIDTADTGVAALITAMEDGLAITGGNFSPVDKRGNDLTTNNLAKKTFLARNNG